MRRAHLATAAKISIGKCGMNAFLEGETAARVHSEEEIKCAHAAIQSLQKKVLKDVRPDLDTLRVSKTQGRKDRQEKAFSDQLRPVMEKLDNLSDTAHDSSAGSKVSWHEESKVVSGMNSKQCDKQGQETVDFKVEFVVDCKRCKKLSVVNTEAEGVCDDCKWLDLLGHEVETEEHTRAGGVKIANTTLEVSQVEAGFVVDGKGKEKFEDIAHFAFGDTECRKNTLMTNLEGCEEYEAGSTAE